ncbi:MAG: hypothetical protein HZA90_25365 [Verrucomicrobia bacterium]|nr:hypothetical protein [Verrucomicrobiota bacterium]
MRARLTIVVSLLVPLLVHANPVKIDGQSALAFGIVAFWALVIESGLATLTLVSTGILIVPSFGTLIIANIGLFLFAFLPLTSRVSLWLLEPGVVLVDAVLVKLVASAPFVQGSEFVGVSWKRALVASLLGNAASYFVGEIASHSPWIAHEPGRFE